MSIKEKNLEKIALKISHYHKKHTPFDLVKKRLWILYHEIIRDDVAIRAESLSYFTLFSIMPIVAGLFLLVSAFSQWAPIQNNFQELIKRILAPLPDEHRASLIAFILDFKDVYLQKISKSGSTLGFFAIIVLVFVLGKVFINIEDLMNRIWSSKENRSWTDRIRNFILVVVVLPTAIFTALSLPGLIEKFGGNHIGVFVEKGLPAILLIGGLFFLFRFFPNVNVKPKNALMGSLLSGVLFVFSNVFLSVYFRFGTQTAYGKAAVIPLLAFFIYVSWFIVMVGAEWSYILQNENNFTDETLNHPNLQQAALLVQVIKVCEKRYGDAKTPYEDSELCSLLKVSQNSLSTVLDYLIEKGIFLKSLKRYSFAYDPNKIDLIVIVKEYLKIDHNRQNSDVNDIVLLISKK